MVGCWVQRAIGAGRVIAGAALIAGCTQVINNDPINQPLTVNARAIEAELRPEVETSSDDMIVALSFSGGGMRAAAFSYGVLTGFDETRVRTRTGPVRCSTASTSSPASPAARSWPPITGCAARRARRFQAALPAAQCRGSAATEFSSRQYRARPARRRQRQHPIPGWLDAHLYNHATLKELLSRTRPRVWINASDIYNRTAFIFGP
jgi:NTE family protein